MWHVSECAQKQALKSAECFFIWRSLRCGGKQCGEDEREMGRGGGVGMPGIGGLCFCYEQNAVKQEQTQFQARSPRGEALGLSARLRIQTKALTSSLLHWFVYK